MKSITSASRENGSTDKRQTGENVKVLGVIPLSSLSGGPGNMLMRIIQDKWSRLVIFVFACFFTSALYYGWQQYQKMLFHDGVYSWLCEAGVQCKAQEDAISRLYSIAAGCEYASAAIGGMFLDHLGPRRSGFIGEIQWGIGTLILALSSQSFQAYIPAMIIIGFSVNVVCFPALTTVENFPEWQGLMVGIALAAQNAATGVPPVLWSIKQKTGCSLRTMWLMYLLCVWLPVTILYTLALPGARDFKEMLLLQRDQLLDAEHGPDCTAPDANVQAEDLIQKKASWREFGRSLLTVDIAVMGLFFSTMMLIYAYYPTVVTYAVSESVSDYLAYAMPTQAFWALLVGVICDVFCTAHVMIAMCACIEIVFLITVITDAPIAQYIACSLLVVSQCAIFEVKYTYVAEMFDPYNFGKLVGFFGVLGGCATFLNIPMSQISNYKMVFTIYLCVIPICAGLAAYLRYRQVRFGSYKTLPETRDLESSGMVKSPSSEVTRLVSRQL